MYSTETAKQVLGKMYVLMGILEVTGADCIDALASHINDYEDAIVEKVAVGKKIDYIVTRNEKDFQTGKVKTIVPDDFIKLVEEGEHRFL